MAAVIGASCQKFKRLDAGQTGFRAMRVVGFVDDAEAALERAHEAIAAVIDPAGQAGNDLGFDHAQAPALFTTAPVGAIKKVLAASGWEAKDIDLFEINEAFAVVTMVAMYDLALPHEKVNVHGGACALGHPIGASGARIITTLIGAMQKMGEKRGVASLCIGGGEATAVAVEIMA